MTTAVHPRPAIGDATGESRVDRETARAPVAESAGGDHPPGAGRHPSGAEP